MQFDPYEAFLTMPTLSKNSSSFEQKKVPTIKDKIYQIFKALPPKQLCLQAVCNLGLPTYFIDLPYIQSQIEQKHSDRELNGLYSALNCIKKEVSKIYRNTQNYQPQTKTQKRIVLSVNRVKTTNRMKHREPLSDHKIRKALEQELKIRKKLKTKQQRILNCQLKKTQYIEKHVQKIKSMNKRVDQIHTKQKQKLLTQANNYSPTKEYIQQPFSIKERNINIRTCIPSQFMKKQIQSSRDKDYQDFYRNICQKEEQLNYRYQSKKHKRLLSMAQKIQEKENKIEQVKIQKELRNKQNFQDKLKNILQKQQKIKQIRSNKNKGINQNFSDGKKSLLTTNNFDKSAQTMTNFSQTDGFGISNNAKIDNNYQKSITQERQILQKIQIKNRRREEMLKIKVQKLKKCREGENLRRQYHKYNKQKQLEEKLKIQNTNGQSKITLIRQFKCNTNPQEDHIKERARKIQSNQETFEAITRMKKLGDHQLQKQLNKYKQKDIKRLFSQKILQFLK